MKGHKKAAFPQQREKAAPKKEKGKTDRAPGKGAKVYPTRAQRIEYEVIITQWQADLLKPSKKTKSLICLWRFALLMEWNPRKRKGAAIKKYPGE